MKSELEKHGSNLPVVPGWKPSVLWHELISSQQLLPPFLCEEAVAARSGKKSPVLCLQP